MAMSNNGTFTFPMKQGVENIVEEDATKAALVRNNNAVTGLVVLCQGLKTKMGEDFICIDNDPDRN